MKRFIVISLLAALVMPVLACAWMETHNYYLFSVYNREEFRSRVDDISRNNWKTYLGISQEESFWFDADRIIQHAQQHGDQLMAGYVKQLDRYLDCVHTKERQQYEWDYPTAQEIAAMNRSLNQIRTFAQGKLNTKLRSQHALLFMRCNMMLGRHSENISFWEQTASKYIETVYKDMMLNIYAGALLKTGRSEKAGQIFAEQGDWHSLMTQYYKKRSYDAIRQEYLRNPQSPVLPFLLQDFVNNAQEAADHDGFGKLFVRDIQHEEAMKMVSLAGQAVREGKTQHPAMWMAAKAWLEYMFDSKVQAQADINKATTLADSERMMDNARVLKFYITSMQTSASRQNDDYVAQELNWLDQKKEDDAHYEDAQDRIVHQAIYPRYNEAGRSETALALLYAVHAYQYGDVLDTMAVDRLNRFLDYVKSPAVSTLDRYLKPKLKIDDNVMTDLLGTKHLRLAQWKEAIAYLEKVPLSFYNAAGYAPYATHRSYKVEPWITHQRMKDDYWSDQKKLTSNPKLDFSREMLDLEKGLNRLNKQKRQQRCYDLAVRYAQASFTGDCWYLTHNGKSVNDTLACNEVDFCGKARELLKEASQASDFLLKERALFALCYYYLHEEHWYEPFWNSEKADMDRKPLPATQHYKTWATFHRFELASGGHTSDYVKRCDEYIQFKKHYRN